MFGEAPLIPQHNTFHISLRPPQIIKDHSKLRRVVECDKECIIDYTPFQTNILGAYKRIIRLQTKLSRKMQFLLLYDIFQRCNEFFQVLPVTVHGIHGIQICTLCRQMRGEIIRHFVLVCVYLSYSNC